MRKKQKACNSCQLDKSIYPNMDCTYFCGNTQNTQIQNNSINKEDVIEVVIDSFKDDTFEYDKDKEKYFLQIPSQKNYEDKIKELQDTNDYQWYAMIFLFVLILFVKFSGFKKDDDVNNKQEYPLIDNKQEERVNKPKSRGRPKGSMNL